MDRKKMEEDLTKQRRCVCSQKSSEGGSMSSSIQADGNEYINMINNENIMNTYISNQKHSFFSIGRG